MTLNHATYWAMDTFRKLRLAEKRLEKVKAEHHAVVVHVPDEDMPEYYRVTQEMDAED